MSEVPLYPTTQATSERDRPKDGDEEEGKRVCVCDRERVSVSQCVCVCVTERVSVSQCVCVCDREREGRLSRVSQPRS